MAEELSRDSHFSEGQDRDSYNSYLKSESDRIDIISRQRHMEKLKRECHARWFVNDRNGETSNSVLDDLNHEHTPFPSREPEDSSSNSLLNSYKASMEEARLSIKHKEDEISILKREKEDYALMSKENFRKSEQRLRDKEEEIARMWHRLETMQSSTTSTPMVRLSGGNVNQDSSVLKVPLRIQSNRSCETNSKISLLTLSLKPMKYY